MTKEPFPLQWDLDRFFQNKGTQEDLSQFIDCLKNHLEELSLALEDASSLPKALQLSQTIAEKLAQLEAFGHCLFAEDVKNTCSLQLQGECRLLQAKFENLSTLLDEHLKNLSDASFKSLLKDPFCQTVAFPIQERKSLAQEKLSLSLESLITNLSIDGYHGYSQLFSTFHGHLNFPFQDAQGLPSTLSIGQIDNLLSSPDREIRCRSFKIYTQVFHEHAPHFAEILNHIGGFRLQVYKQRNWHCFLKEPLQANRMQEATLNSLWEAVQTHTQGFAKFLKKKAALLHLEALDWHDVDAPLFSSTQTIPYATACETILEQFHNYSPKMASFAKRALTQRWVEAEDRPGKAAGGFCIPLPLHKESRIFMTYSGTQDNVSTLAHELGHAYHNEILFSHPYLAQNIKMNVAETASTMAEMILADASLQKASSKEEKLSILDDKISRSIAFFMNIQARFLFEKNFYQERAQGYILPERLSSLMLEAQKQAYCNSLSTYHPYFWASKMHFYFTDAPFYNFPYTFGYLFSLGIYTLLKKDCSSFEKNYDALLYDTPLMTTEDLAKKHLGVDLTQRTFWDLALQEALKDVELFFNLL